jgi:trk system potassium uptake protein
MMRAIFSPISGLLMAFAGLMEIPALIDYFVHSQEWQAFQVSALVTLFVGLSLFILREKGESHLTLRSSYLFTVVSWLFICFLGALPFYWSSQNVTLTDAFFESVSGLTTTGSTVFSGLDDMPPGIILWRAMLQWTGGIGIIVMAIAIFPLLKTGGMQLFQLESSESSDKMFPRIREMSIGVFAIYSFLTLLCGTLYYVEGMTFFESVIHAMTTLSTGGFSTSDLSMAKFPQLSIVWTSSFFMVMGTLPFALMLFAVKHWKWEVFFGNSQVQVYLLFLFFTCVGIGFSYYQVSEEDIFRTFSIATFNVISVVTTTGYAYGDYTTWGHFVIVTFFFLTFVGGCSGSTTGGIKFFRIQILWLHVQKEMRRLFFPSCVLVQSLNRRPITNEVAVSVLIFLSFLMFSFTLVTLLLSMTGLDLITSLSAAATALSNVGPGLGAVIGPAGNFATLSDSAKWVLDAAMILGRLEFVTVFALFHYRFWQF